MSFVSLDFLIFFPAIFALYWALSAAPRGRALQNVLLLAGSLLFYGYLHPWLVLLLLYSALLDYGAALAMVRWPGLRKQALLLSVLGNLSLLGTFKYADFFVQSASSALRALGADAQAAPLGLLLPAGISFFTFQTMSYTIDVYRGQLQPRRNLVDYLLFVSFFPQLVAGPIERASRLLPQVESERIFELTAAREGLLLLLWGAFKKVVIADSLALPVDATFGQHEPSFAMIWAASAAFSVQLFADFSGYTDMARGSARMLGFRLSENFDAPFLSTSPSQWWGRWHMSFSSWMRDYVFQPLALAPWFRRLSPRGSSIRSHGSRALFVTMLLGGLWHGAGWNFVLWGAMFGALQWVWSEAARILPPRLRAWPEGRYVLIALMLVATTFSSMLFREHSLSRLATYLALPPLGGTRHQWLAALTTACMTASLALPLVAVWDLRARILPALPDKDLLLPLQTTAIAILLWAVFTFAQPGAASFVYFQF